MLAICERACRIDSSWGGFAMIDQIGKLLFLFCFGHNFVKAMFCSFDKHLHASFKKDFKHRFLLVKLHEDRVVLEGALYRNSLINL